MFKRLGEQLSSPAMALVKSFLSAALLGVVLLVMGFDRVSLEALLWLALSGAVGIALGDTLFFAALKQLSPHTLIMLLTSGQILTVVLAILFLGEAPTVKTWLGISLVVMGITVVLWSKLSGPSAVFVGRASLENIGAAEKALKSAWKDTAPPARGGKRAGAWMLMSMAFTLVNVMTISLTEPKFAGSSRVTS